MKKNKLLRIVSYNILFLILLITVAIVSISIGSKEIGFFKIIEIIFQNSENKLLEDIILNIRLPRVILGLSVGGALSISGLLLQGIFKNPLVEPFTLGISGGASLGISLATLFNIGNIFGIFSYPVFGFISAMAIIVLVYNMGIEQNKLQLQSILLIGVMISFISSSLVMLIMALSGERELNTILFWLMGNLNEPNFNLILISFFVSIVALILSFLISYRLNIFSLGEEEARSLGIDVERVKKYVFILASLTTGVCVAVAGVISFVGLIIPHTMRIIFGNDNRYLIISSYLLGGTFLILSDTLARTIAAPIELPVGVITGIVGGISFVYLLNYKKVRL